MMASLKRVKSLKQVHLRHHNLIKVTLLLLIILMLMWLVGCESRSENIVDETNNEASEVSGEIEDSGPSEPCGSDDIAPIAVDEQPGTVYYEIFVRAFADSNGDGTGDFNGVTAKLDYLQALGMDLVNAH